MRTLAVCALLASCCLSAPAAAGIGVSVETETYAISGDSGATLMKAMDRKGPRHGFLTRAIAQTRYTVNWTLKWKQTSRACSLEDARADLSIGYRYPKLARKVSPALGRSWTRFLSGVRKHEEMHGRMAREMVGAAHKSVRRVSFKDDPSCRKAQKEVSRLVAAIYATYEARQRAFDAKEHSVGGNVDRLVGSLIRGK